MPNKLKKTHLLDYGILIPYLILSVVGLMMVYSTTSYIMLDKGSFFAGQAIKQAVFWVFSVMLLWFVYKMKTEYLRSIRFTRVTMIVTAIMLVAVFGFKPINQAYGWIQLPGIGTIQPVEFLKFVVIWLLSATLAQRQSFIQDNFWKSTRYLLIIIAIELAIVAKGYPDFGNAAVIFLLVMIVILSSGINYLYTFYAGVATIVGSTIAVFLVNQFSKFITAGGVQHVLKRFAMFRNPFLDEFGDGHQQVQGYYAMFNGGLLGRGLGNSIQKKGFLKFAETDFAFTVLVEELGLLAAIIVLGLLFFMIARIIIIGIRSNDAFNSMMCIGIGSLFLISVFINFGGVTGMIPLTGITFPFISQGGSSLLMFSICIGFVLNISADEKKKQYLTEMN